MQKHLPSPVTKIIFLPIRAKANINKLLNYLNMKLIVLMDADNIRGHVLNLTLTHLNLHGPPQKNRRVKGDASEKAA